MKKTFIFLALFISLVPNIFAQSKKDLLAEIDKLRTEVKSKDAEINEANKNARISESKVEVLQEQMQKLQETNNSILSKMGSFTELSTQKSKNLEQSLQTIKKKDEQLNTVNLALEKADSTMLATFSLFKSALKDVSEQEAKLTVINGAVAVAIANDFLFESTQLSVISASAQPALEKIAAALQRGATLKFEVWGNSNELDFKSGASDNWDLSSLQAAALVRKFQTDFTIEPNRMQVVGKGQYATAGVETNTIIYISPGHTQFYGKVKESMKN